MREAGNDLGCYVGLDGGPWLGGSGSGSGQQRCEVPRLDGGEDGEVWERGIVGYYFEAEVVSEVGCYSHGPCVLSSIAARAASRNWSAFMLAVVL